MKETNCPGTTAKYSGSNAGNTEFDVVADGVADALKVNEALAPQTSRTRLVVFWNAADDAAEPLMATGV